MKNIIILKVLIFAFALNVNAQDSLSVKSDIKNVTVYRRGAMINRIADKFIRKGKTILIFDNLSSKLDVNTIKVKVPTNITLVSLTQTYNFLNKKKNSEQISKLSNNSQSLQDSIQLQNNIITVLNDERQMILANRTIGGESNGVDIENLKKVSEFYRTKLGEIELYKLNAANKIRKFTKEITLITYQLRELNAGMSQTTSEIIIVISSKKDMAAKFDISYYISDAGWSPYYDVRVKNISEKIVFNYKAHVFQNTGYDWKNVKLLLSTGNPSLSGMKPSLTSDVLGQGGRSVQTYSSNYNPKVLTGQICDYTGAGIPGALIKQKGTTIATITDLNGYYSLDTDGHEHKYVASYMGLKSYEFSAASGGVNVTLQEDDTQIEDVVVTAIGIKKSRKALSYSVVYVEDDYTSYDALSGKTSGVQIRGGSNFKGQNIPIKNKVKLSTFYDFKIKDKYTILSNRKNYDVLIEDLSIAADYEYSLVPKLSKKAFLTAVVTERKENRMISGQANIFFQDAYTGKTSLNFDSYTDTLLFSLGIDNDIIVKRELEKDFSKTKIIGSNTKVDKHWKITVKNNKTFPVTINVEDLVPISPNNKVKVDILELSSAKYDENSGMLKWKLELKAGESKELNIKYSVKFPSEYRILVD